MKKVTQCMKLLSLTFIIILSSCGGSNNSEKKTSYSGATKELVDMADKDPELKSLLVASIEKAKQINPDTNTNPVQSLDEYYNFVSKAETTMPWALVRNG